MSTVHVVVPDGLDDPSRPSGGNLYDRRVCDGLEELGWSVHEHPVGAAWPEPDRAAVSALTRVLGGVPDGGLVLIDGLVASAAPEPLRQLAGRLRVVPLVHLPLGAVSPGDRRRAAAERAALTAAAEVLTTSRWTRTWLTTTYGLHGARVHVAEPGVDAADLASGSPRGDRILCVGAVTLTKGHDVLVDALLRLTGLPWQCDCAGSLEREPAFVEGLRGRLQRAGVAERASFLGALGKDDLDDVYAGADLLVVPSRVETYGMVVTEALARGIPVVAAEVGGVPDALGRVRDGSTPGCLVRPEDPDALAEALRRWLVEPEWRLRLRCAARERRGSLPGWDGTARTVAHVLTGTRICVAR